MEPARIPLEERLGAARAGRVCQPEYFPCLIRRWAEMPIRTYFGVCNQELERLCRLLDIAPEDNPSYQDVAAMICKITYAEDLDNRDEEAMDLLAAPVRAFFNAQNKKRGGD